MANKRTNLSSIYGMQSKSYVYTRFRIAEAIVVFALRNAFNFNVFTKIYSLFAHTSDNFIAFHGYYFEGVSIPFSLSFLFFLFRLLTNTTLLLYGLPQNPISIFALTLQKSFFRCKSVSIVPAQNQRKPPLSLPAFVYMFFFLFFSAS